MIIQNRHRAWSLFLESTWCCNDSIMSCGSSSQLVEFLLKLFVAFAFYCLEWDLMNLWSGHFGKVGHYSHKYTSEPAIGYSASIPFFCLDRKALGIPCLSFIASNPKDKQTLLGWIEPTTAIFYRIKTGIGQGKLQKLLKHRVTCQ